MMWSAKVGVERNFTVGSSSVATSIRNHKPPPRAAVMRASPFHSSLSSSPNKPSSSSSSSEQHPRATVDLHQPRNFLHNHPPLNSNLSLQFKEKILCLEIIGIDSGKALSSNPTLHSTPLESIHSVISFLQSKGIHQNDLPRIFGIFPQILTSDIKSDLAPIFHFLTHDLKIPDQNLRRVINKCPRLLVSSVKDQLKSTLFYLQRLGFVNSQSLAYQDPILLVSSVKKTLIPKLDCLVSLGFTKRDAVEMVLRCPSLFTFSIEKNFLPKFEYFSKEMGGKLEELRNFPQYFAFSLEKRIKVRHAAAIAAGIKVPLPVLLKTTDDEFIEVLMRQGNR